ncbi:MAG TPA: hypothetical protein RMG95_27790 [Polyangiaceae bacterium LLY-WYZ-15_(1-7)]|nr:hypothetical protein [Polyangiaceae bacterium LLY-WYZ-15_(1-7)]HJL33717.1 hypothetical protein [Polyangiaceae bacterium LLY-WYZ-15_(1-7)]HJL39528.1 hypothetical protein [Polyangiaceae bacterium LLY-WYZ-15_(1-7)]
MLATAPGGQVLATNDVPHVALEDWLEVLRRCAAKAGCPLGEVEPITQPARNRPRTPQQGCPLTR